MIIRTKCVFVRTAFCICKHFYFEWPTVRFHNRSGKRKTHIYRQKNSRYFNIRWVWQSYKMEGSVIYIFGAPAPACYCISHVFGSCCICICICILYPSTFIRRPQRHYLCQSFNQCLSVVDVAELLLLLSHSFDLLFLMKENECSLLRHLCFSFSMSPSLFAFNPINTYNRVIQESSECMACWTESNA